MRQLAVLAGTAAILLAQTARSGPIGGDNAPAATGPLMPFATGIAPPTGPLTKQQQEGRRELEKAAHSLIPRPSTDTTPIAFSVGGVHYQVPRNYVITMDNWSGGPQVLVTLQVNLADLQPVTPATVACFIARPTDRPPGCEPFKFWIEGTGGVSSDQAFANASKLFHSITPRPTAYGYNEYEIGPDNARIEYYKRVENGKTRLYSCQPFDNRGKRDGICSPISDRMPAGGTIHFFFRLSQMPKIEQIDRRLREIVESFTVSGEETDGIGHTQPEHAKPDQHRAQPGNGNE